MLPTPSAVSASSPDHAAARCTEPLPGRWSRPVSAIHSPREFALRPVDRAPSGRWRVPLGSHAILEERCLSGNLLEDGLAASLLPLLKAIEAIAAIAHQPTGLGNIVELLGSLTDTHLSLDAFLVRRHGPLLP